MAYNKDTDYQALINAAVANGDYRAAANYEQQRNEKINDLNASGGNKWNATVTNDYSNWLNNSYADSGSADGVGVYTVDQAAGKSEMNGNSLQWYDATDAGKASLHAENEYIASLLGSGVVYDPKTGTWSGDADGTAAQKASGTVVPSYSYDTPRPTYESNYSAQIDALLDQILNREDFSYDFNSDPLYQQYLSQYTREGNRAMNDTLAAAAANAGGMNSYAITAAQQANNYYTAQAADKIPELYQLAYQMYLDDIDLQVQDLGLVQQMDDTQYGRYRDTMSDWENDRDFAYNMYRDDMSDYKWNAEFNYNASRDEVADKQWQQQFDYNVGIYDREWDYGVEQDDYNKVWDMLAAGVMPDDALLESAGVTRAEAAAVLAKNGGDATVSSGGSGGSGSSSGGGGSTSSGGGSYNNAGLSTDEVKAIQQQYGASADGKWGAETTRLVGMTAAEWVEKNGGGNDLIDDLLGDNKTVVEPLDTEINGVPYLQYEEQAANYDYVAKACEELYKKEGKEAVLDMLRDMRQNMNLNDYSRLFNKYRNMG